MRLMYSSLTSLATKHAIDYPTPVSLSYLWGFGSTSGVLLASQLFTGVFLSMHYTPHVDLAYLSVEHICRDVHGGWLLRYTHSNGASVFFLLVYLHLFRGLYFTSYRGARNVVWVVGVALFIVMMATAFMGYVLPWGQMSLWAATVITSLFSAVPYCGSFIVEWLWGGFSVDNATLNRFFALHFVLPFLLAALALIHIASLHTVGSCNPLGLLSSDKVSFYPAFWCKDIFVWLLSFLLLFVFVFFFPNALGHSDNYIEANSLVTPPHIVPEVYFLPFYAILRSVPNKLGGVLLMFAALVVLVVTPWLNTAPSRVFSFLTTHKVAYWLLVVVWLLLGWVGAQSPDLPFSLMGKLCTLAYFSYFTLLPVTSVVEACTFIPYHLGTKFKPINIFNKHFPFTLGQWITLLIAGS